MNTNLEGLKKVWETCSTTFAHITPDKWLQSEEHLFKTYEDNVISHIIPENKVIIDYGIGGGFLGKLLLSKYNIKKYIGIDIAERSINNAKINLKEWEDKCEFYFSSIDFSKLNGDIFISLACIQHFPNEEYTIDFLNNLNKSNIKEIFLQVRNKDNTTNWKNDYDCISNVQHSCYITKEYINQYLTNYKVDYVSEISSGTNYQFLKFIFIV